MSSFPWHRRFSAEVEEETCSLSAEEFGVLTRIVDRLQSSGHPLRADRRYLSNLAGVGPRRCWQILERLIAEGHLASVEYNGRPCISCKGLDTELAWRAERSQSARQSARSPRKNPRHVERTEQIQNWNRRDRSANALEIREHNTREQPGRPGGPGCSSTHLNSLIRRCRELLGGSFTRSYITSGKVQKNQFIPHSMTAYDKIRRENVVLTLLREEGLELVSPDDETLPKQPNLG